MTEDNPQKKFIIINRYTGRQIVQKDFDLLDDKQLYVCFNWRNYQPLWGLENLEKQDFYTKDDEEVWIRRMRELGFEGELFTLYK